MQGYDAKKHDAGVAEALAPVFAKLKRSLIELVKQRLGVQKADDLPFADRISMEALIDSDFVNGFDKAMKERIKKVLRESGKKTFAQIDLKFTDEYWDEVAEKYYQERFYGRGTLYTVSRTLREDIGDIITETMSESELTNREVMEVLREKVENMTGFAAERIARTENFLAATRGQVSTWKELGITKWDLDTMEVACPLCDAIANGGRPSDYGDYTGEDDRNYHGNSYTEIEMMRVTHFDDGLPHPGCRCVWIPAVESEEEYSEFEQTANAFRERILAEQK